MRRGFYRTTYFLGLAAGKTWHWITSPYTALTRAFSGTDGRTERSASTATRTRKLFSRISSINTRLSTIESSISRAEQQRETRKRGSRHEPRREAPLPENADELTQSLAEALGDPDPAVREIALKTLGEMKGEEVVVLILESLHDSDPHVRAAAAAAAAGTGSPTAIFSLILLLNDGELEVRQQALAAIEAITGKRVDFDPEDEPRARKKRAEELQDWWKEERFAKLSGELKIALKEWKNK